MRRSRSPLLAAVALPLALAQAQPRPFLGVSMTVHSAEIEVDDQTFKHGIRIETVVPDSGAYAGGLRAGDILVGVGGVDFDCKPDELLPRFREKIGSAKIGDSLELTVFRDGVDRRATLDGAPFDDEAVWDDPDQHIRDRDRGSRLELVAERVRALLTLRATLGTAPESVLAAKTLPPNSEIMPRPPAPLLEEALAEFLIAEFNAESDYRDLRQRLAKLVESGDAFRLSRFAYAMREPFAMPALARGIADVPADLPQLLRHAAEWSDAPISASASPKRLKTGLTPAAHVEQIAELLTEANDLLEQALAELSAEERAFLESAAGDFSTSFIENLVIQEDPNRKRRQNALRFVELAAKVDRARLAQAALHLSALLETRYLSGLRKDLAGKGAGVILKHDTPFGPIILAGPADAWVREPAAVYIDLGGNEFYTQATQRPFNILIDLAGDDLHQATFDFSQGAALLGVALLYDREGDDTYIAQRWAQGSAAIGVGVLIDKRGDDLYRGADFSQAVAFCGIGVLIDHNGRDRYDAPRYAQALGLPGGFAVLRDRAGDDHYYCSGRDRTGYETQGVFDGWGQACGLGFRNLASGGIALLRDDAGDDIYEGGNFTQGGGYYFGWGCLVDKAGNDRYLGSRYAQAFAAHQAIGFLEDHGGNDRYVARRGVGQSCAWDECITALIEHAGNDTYSGGGFGLGASAHNGLAILSDHAGRDRYQQHTGAPRAHPNDYHGGTSFSLLLDLGGDKDTYAGKGRNNVVTHAPQHGFFGDFPGDLPRARREFQKLIQR